MTETYLTKIVPALRAAGLTVYETAGWMGRCRCHEGSHYLGVKRNSRGWQKPYGITWHHTAGALLVGQKAIDYAWNILIGGNGITPGPLCMFGVDGDGRVIMVGAGRCNHLGSISSAAEKAIKAGTWNPNDNYDNKQGSGRDGNSITAGIEIYAKGAPNDKQRSASIIITAVMCQLLGVSPNSTHGHGEASNQRDYSDPGLDMGSVRRAVAKKISDLKTGNIIPGSKPSTPVTAPTTPNTTKKGFTDMDQNEFNKLMDNWSKTTAAKDWLKVNAMGGTHGIDVNSDGMNESAGSLIAANYQNSTVIRSMVKDLVDALNAQSPEIKAEGRIVDGAV